MHGQQRRFALVVEQFGVPQQIYDWPATKFVAEFIGTPPMNFLDFEGTVPNGATQVALGEAVFAVPEQLTGAQGALTLGVRPEHKTEPETVTTRGSQE